MSNKRISPGVGSSFLVIIKINTDDDASLHCYDDYCEKKQQNNVESIIISIKGNGAVSQKIVFNTSFYKTRKEEMYYFSSRLLIEDCKVLLLALEFHSKTIRRCVKDQF